MNGLRRRWGVGGGGERRGGGKEEWEARLKHRCVEEIRGFSTDGRTEDLTVEGRMREERVGKGQETEGEKVRGCSSPRLSPSQTSGWSFCTMHHQKITHGAILRGKNQQNKPQLTLQFFAFCLQQHKQDKNYLINHIHVTVWNLIAWTLVKYF